MRSHHTPPLLRENTELGLAARIDGGMTMSIRSSTAAFVATLVLAFCGPLHAGPEGQLLLSTAHAQSKVRTVREAANGYRFSWVYPEACNSAIAER